MAPDLSFPRPHLSLKCVRTQRSLDVNQTGFSCLFARSFFPPPSSGEAALLLGPPSCSCDQNKQSQRPRRDLHQFFFLFRFNCVLERRAGGAGGERAGRGVSPVAPVRPRALVSQGDGTAGLVASGLPRLHLTGAAVIPVISSSGRSRSEPLTGFDSGSPGARFRLPPDG